MCNTLGKPIVRFKLDMGCGAAFMKWYVSKVCRWALLYMWVCVCICVYIRVCVCLCEYLIQKVSDVNWTGLPVQLSALSDISEFLFPPHPLPSCAISNVTINKRARGGPSLSQPCCIVLCWTKRALSWLGASLWQLSTKWNYIVNKLATLPVQCWKATTTAMTMTTTGRTLFIRILISICRFQTSTCKLNVLTTSI